MQKAQPFGLGYLQEPKQILLAPRPGLEPGTYGLTVERCHFLMAPSAKNFNGFLVRASGDLLRRTYAEPQW